jgi:hypothetical protein
VRFEVATDPTQPRGIWSRLLDRFNWVQGVAGDRIEDADLNLAASYFPRLREFRLAERRLLNGLLLTLAGCMAHNWQVAFICHAGAAEALLTFDTGKGITRRLATAYACLVETVPADRDRAFREFQLLYGIRSDIMHGRTHTVSAADRLPYLARFEEVLRRIWTSILSSPPTVVADLEGSDQQRKRYFQQVGGSYVAPQS